MQYYRVSGRKIRGMILINKEKLDDVREALRNLKEKLSDESRRRYTSGYQSRNGVLKVEDWGMVTNRPINTSIFEEAEILH